MSRSRPQRNYITAFTLIELLVVISLMCLLAALLFPAFARVRAAGQRTSCMSNVRQIGLALIEYSEDEDGRFPPNQTIGLGRTFPTLLLPYVKSDAVYLCPSASHEASDSTNDAELRDAKWVVHQTDGWLADATGNYGISKYLASVHTSRLESPGQILLVSDSSWYAVSVPDSPGSSIRDAARHFDGVNVCFADGHTKWAGIDKDLPNIQFIPY